MAFSAARHLNQKILLITKNARCFFISPIARRFLMITNTAKESQFKEPFQQLNVGAGSFSVQISNDRKSLIIKKRDQDHLMQFQSIWLRNNCQCDQCRQPFSGQKLINAALLQSSYSIRSVSSFSKDITCVTWQEEEHLSLFPLSFLYDNEYSTSALNRLKMEVCPSPCPQNVPTMTRSDLEQRAGILQWLKLINEYGICVIQNVPISDGEVRHTAELIGPIQHSIYGDVWNVISDPKPINVAYSDAQLEFHMDLAYYESPPGIQFLHCLKFDDCVQGGDSLFVDAWIIAETMRTSYPDEFEILSKVPVTFQKIHFTRENPVHMKYRRPHIALDADGGIVAVYWAPAFEGPLCVPAHQVEDYYRAYQTYAQLLHSSATKLKFRLAPGELVSFNNRRILHGRDKFSLNGGSRHLQGCYMNIDEFCSSMKVIAKSLDASLHIKNVFNQNWI